MARRIGRAKKRVAFYRKAAGGDPGAGIPSSGWEADPFLQVSGEWWPERTAEAMAAGRLQSEIAGRLIVRSSIAARGVTAAEKVAFDGEDYQILGIMQADQFGHYLEMRIERGVAV